MFTSVIILFMIGSAEFEMGATSKKSSRSAFVYPGPVKHVTENRYGSSSDEVPEKCKFQDYCTEKPANYPQEYFNNMFKNFKPVPLPNPTLIISEHGVRLGDDDSDDGCESEVSFEPLYKVREKRGSWRTVVQAPEVNYIQQVRLEVCTNPKGSCFNDFPSLPGITTFCKQKTSTWQFLVADDKGGTEKLDVELPICCSCHYKNTN